MRVSERGDANALPACPHAKQKPLRSNSNIASSRIFYEF